MGRLGPVRGHVHDPRDVLAPRLGQRGALDVLEYEVALALVLVGLPGAWLLIATAIAIDCLDWIWLAPNAPLTFHPLTIVVAIFIATAGEAMEFSLSAAGAKRFGASRAGMIGAMIGGAIGAIAATGVTYVSVGRLTQSAPAADIRPISEASPLPSPRARPSAVLETSMNGPVSPVPKGELNCC